MKIGIIADLHLTEKFDINLYQDIISVLTQVDRIILNGDFVEGWSIDIKDFLNSKWNQLFPYLLEKNCVYISGNHDSPIIMSDYTKHFSKLFTDIYQIDLDNIKIILQHKPLYVSDKLEKLLRFRKFVKFIRKSKFINLYHKLSHNNAPYLKFLFSKKTKNCQKAIYKWLSKNQVNDFLYIFSHTHYQEYIQKLNYVNTGEFKKNREYIIIDTASNEIQINHLSNQFI